MESKKLFFSIPVIFILINFSSLLKAQENYSERSESFYTYVYTISPEECIQIVKEDYYYITDAYQHTLIDSVETASIREYKAKMEVGHYILSYAKEQRVYNELFSKNSIEAEVLTNDRDLSLNVHKKGSDEVIENAIVKINKKSVPYNSDSKTYTLEKSNKKGLLVIQVEDEYLLYELKREVNNSGFKRGYRKVIYSIPLRYILYPFQRLYYSIRSRNFYFRKNYNNKYKGYITFNKPKYLPNDTLYWKAFVTNKKGKAIKDDLTIKLSEGYSISNTILSQEVKTESEGSYFGEIHLSDSLEINRSYFFSISNSTKKNRELSERVYLEDYELDESFYTVKNEKEEYGARENVNFTLSAKDVNGYNLLDSRVRLELYTKRVQECYADVVFVPILLFEKEFILDPIGDTKITIPDSIFPQANLQLTANFQFNNSNNEIHTEEENFMYDGQQYWIDVRISADSIYANFLNNGKTIDTIGVVSVNGQLNERDITFPFKEMINFSVGTYIFSSGFISENFSLRGEDDLFEINSHREKDSLFISSTNPRNIPFHYFIYKKTNKIFERGYTIHLDKGIKVDPDESISISAHYNWAGYSEDKFEHAFVYEKNLILNIDQPEQVYPGQTVDINISVEDINEEPVEGVNLTVGSINGKFDDSYPTYTPYLGKQPRVQYYINSFNLGYPNNKSTRIIDSTSIAQMHLDTIPYYMFSHPENGLILLYDSTYSIENAQFSPHIFSYGSPVDVFLIYIDEELIYYSKSDIKEDYSFIVDEGYHSVRIRTKNEELYIDSILFKPKNKLEIFIDLNELPQIVKRVEKPNYLDEDECLLLNSSFIAIKNNFHGNKAYLKQGDKLLEIGRTNRYSSLYKIGPIHNYSLSFIIEDSYNMDFIFEPGYLYTFAGNKVIMKELTLFQPKKQLREFYFNQVRGQVKRKVILEGKDEMAEWKLKLKKSDIGSSFNADASLKYDYLGDSIFCMFQLKSLDSTYVRGFLTGNITTFLELPEGYYQMLFYTCNKSLLLLDSILIQNGGLNYYRFDDSDLVQIDSIQMYLDPILYTPPDTSTYTISYEDMHEQYSKGAGLLKGNVVDFETDEPIPFAAVVIKKGNKQIAGTATDFDGNYVIRPIKPGVYDVYISVVGYNAKKITGVLINANRISFLDVFIEAGVDLEACDVIAYSIPLISKDGGSSGGRVTGMVTSEDISKMPLRNATSVASAVAGVSTDGYANVSIRGSRSESTYYYIDGVKVIGTANLPKSAIQESEVPGRYLGENSLLYSLASSSGIRENFSDYAFWYPDLYSDEKGEVQLSVKFPDNVTKWETFVLAMNNKKQTGTAFAESKSIKPLIAQVSSPRFLIEEDTSFLLTKITNYTPDKQDIKTSFSLNGLEVSSKDTSIVSSLIDFHSIRGKGEGLLFQYQIETPFGFKDGEKRSIPVYPKGLNATIGDFYYLTGDTSITLSLNATKSPVSLKIYADEVEPLLDDLNYLKSYPYHCMEQTASRLLAYLLEGEMDITRGMKVEDRTKIKKLIRRLEKGMNADGSWGWWPNSSTNYWMTIYIIDILNKAEELGFDASFIDLPKRVIVSKLDYLYKNDLLFALKVLSSADVKINYRYYLSSIERDSLSDYQRLIIETVRQNIGFKYSLNCVNETVKETYLGNLYWEDSSSHFYDNSVNMSMLAYQLIATKDSLDPRLPKIRSYLMEIKGEGRYMNTIDRSRMVKTILPGLLADLGKDLKVPEIQLKGVLNENIKDYPYVNELKEGDIDLEISKIGNGPLFISTSQEIWEPFPEKRDSSFTIESWFELKGEKLDSIPVGEIIEMKIRVDAKKKGKYIMIQVPIPAGCSYGNNDHMQNRMETHREYHKEKTTIYVETMNMGEHIYTIQLQSRYKGVYTLNPAKVELMYMPVFNGNNELEKISIY